MVVGWRYCAVYVFVKGFFEFGVGACRVLHRVSHCFHCYIIFCSRYNIVWYWFFFNKKDEKTFVPIDLSDEVG